jgi:hypothetical protein
VSGAASQVSEFRAGHLDPHGFFQNPSSHQSWHGSDSRSNSHQ